MQELALKVLIRQRHMSYDAFCHEWDRVAGSVDERSKGRYPGHAQYYRWLRGDLLNGRPYPDACRMLEAMFPGWSVEGLFSPYCADDSFVAPATDAPRNEQVCDAGILDTAKLSDLVGAYTSRSQFMSDVPLFGMFESASLIRASGLSLNLLTQHFPEVQIRRLVEQGTRFQLIFLDPECEAMKLREQEEGYDAGFLSGLTNINLSIMMDRVRGKLDSESRERFALALSDKIIRFNIFLLDQKVCIFQPYLPDVRGVDSPTFMVDTGKPESGLFHVFDQVFTSLWKQAKPL